MQGGSIMITDSLVRQFKTIVGADNAWTDETDLHTYSYDAAVVDPVNRGSSFGPPPARHWAKPFAYATIMACRSL
jgi:hypothetical protein